MKVWVLRGASALLLLLLLAVVLGLLGRRRHELPAVPHGMLPHGGGRAVGCGAMQKRRVSLVDI